MFQWVLLVSLLAAAAAEEPTVSDQQAAADASPNRQDRVPYATPDRHGRVPYATPEEPQDGYENWRRNNDQRQHPSDNIKDPRWEKHETHDSNIRRVLNPSLVAFDQNDPHQKAIIEELNNPLYVQPTWILDYRYLPSGKRDYTRSDGGQLLLLPKGIKSRDKKDYDFDNYDDLIEYLKKKQLEETRMHLRSKSRVHDIVGPHDHRDL